MQNSNFNFIPISNLKYQLKLENISKINENSKEETQFEDKIEKYEISNIMQLQINKDITEIILNDTLQLTPSIKKYE